MGEKHYRVDISSWVIAKVIMVLISFYLLFLIRDIIALLFIVLIMVAAFNPLINHWEKRIGRGPAVAALFLIIILIIAGVISIIVPSLVQQISQLIDQVPELLGRFQDIKNHVPALEKNLATISQSLTDVTGGFLSLTAGVFGGVFTLLTAIVITVYMLLDKSAFSNFVVTIIPAQEKDQMLALFEKIGQKLGNWFRGQLILGGVIGLVDLIGLLIIGVPYALTLAIISGLLEIVPTVGPIAAGAIAALVALTVAPVKVVFVIVLYVIVQQLEGTFLVPKIMQKAVGLSPVIIIFAVLIGAKLLGLTGALLAVPLAGSISVLVQDWPTIRRTLHK